MAKDEEGIMFSFKEFISKHASLVTYYEMDAEQVAEFNNRVMKVKRNPDPSDFPDFIGDLIDVEVFNVTSSKEKGKGARFFKEKSALEKRMDEALKPSADPAENRRGRSFVETMEYNDHTYEFWLASLEKNIESHKESRMKYNPDGKECAFIAHYTQKVLSYKDENGIEQWHKLGVDRKALSIVFDKLKGLVNFFVLFDEISSEAEVIPTRMIPSYLDKHSLNYDFYPRSGAGIIRIGISEIISF